MGSTEPAGTTDPQAEKIEAAVLSRISPSAELLEKVRRARERLVARATEAAQKLGTPPVRPLVAGSAARGTFLQDRIDIDLFLLFPVDLDREGLARHGLAIARAILSSPEERYAEHPYLRGMFEGFAIDAVPGYAVADPSQPKSAVDRTPFHHAYLTERQTPEQVSQVRLAKQFLKSLGVYGSEARTAGFSGYLVELLILRFGSLRGLLRASLDWRPPVRLQSAGSEPRTPPDVALVLDDPVDPHRNVASALSVSNLALFLLAARQYVEHPSPKAFERRPPKIPTFPQFARRLKERQTRVIGIVLPRPRLVDDVLYPQLRKAEKAVADEARRLGFGVIGSSSAAGAESVTLLLELDSGKLPLVWKHDGPPPGVPRAEDFLTKWSAAKPPVLQGPYVQADGRLAVEVRRREREVEPLLNERLRQLPIGRDLQPLVGSRVKILPLHALPRKPELREALFALFEKRLPWL
jgi:tRNA nucleotidyltransferase (CCA-adding enzyme)